MYKFPIIVYFSLDLSLLFLPPPSTDVSGSAHEAVRQARADADLFRAHGLPVLREKVCIIVIIFVKHI